MNPEIAGLITTDGFKFYERVIGRVFGPACVYGQVIKTRRSDRVVKVERRTVIGAGRLKQALRSSENSERLNTSFVERMSLTIRQGSAYLGRPTICQARWKERLEDHIELFRCYYNFIRPHGALTFGREIRTPAMQAGLTETAWLAWVIPRKGTVHDCGIYLHHEQVREIRQQRLSNAGGCKCSVAN